MTDHTHNRPAQDAAAVAKRSSLLVTLTIGVFIVGAIVAGIVWIFASGSTGEDISILIACVTFTLMITFMSVRELLRTGRRVETKC